jgi:hypothetical protein
MIRIGRARRSAGLSAAGLVLAAAAAALLLGRPAPLAADKAEEPLAKYEQPVDEAIDRALEFLAARQQKDGAFPAARSQVGITGLSVMAFLAKGHTPGCGPYGETINRGIDYVLSRQTDAGVFPPRMYTHCICTLMLSEVSGMVDAARQRRIDPALAKALKVILAAQKVSKHQLHQGGWRYSPSSRDSDISCTGWALMALRSARNNGAAIPKSAIDQAVKFVRRCRADDGGFAYTPGGGSGLARTGTALLCLELCGEHREKVCLGAGDWILKHLPRRFGNRHFYYGLYYCAQGTFQLGGDYWVRFARHMYEMMLKFQAKDGSWPPGPNSVGPCYATAMSVLAISVTYRQLPIYQR